MVLSHGDPLGVPQTGHPLSSYSASVPASPSIGSIPHAGMPLSTRLELRCTCSMDSETGLGNVIQINIIEKVYILQVVTSPEAF